MPKETPRSHGTGGFFLPKSAYDMKMLVPIVLAASKMALLRMNAERRMLMATIIRQTETPWVLKKLVEIFHGSLLENRFSIPLILQ